MSRREWLELWPAFWRLVRVRLALARHSVKHCEQHFDGGLDDQAASQAEDTDPQVLHTWRRRALAFKRVNRLVPGAHCLARSLALRWWMRSQGLPARLVIGIRKDPASDAILSHAWTELWKLAIDEQEHVVALHQPIKHHPAPERGKLL